MPSQHYQGEKVSQEASFINEISRHMIWYQEKRIKQSLGAISPIEFIKSLGLVAWSKKISALPTSGEPYFPRTRSSRVQDSQNILGRHLNACTLRWRPFCADRFDEVR